jgi:biofilm PGA synthesis N-glycosyltransferase PgaC
VNAFRVSPDEVGRPAASGRPRHARRSSQRRVLVVIPAHNEAGGIGQTLESLSAQTISVSEVLVVADNCTDDTATIAEAQGASVMHTRANTHMKAGALNQGLEYLLPLCRDSDFVLAMDADSRLVPRFVETAVRELAAHPEAGAVCAAFAGEPGRPGAIHVLQRSEYTRFALSIARRRAAAQVLSGVATVFPVGTLNEIKEARLDGRLPPAPGIYDVTAATEDIEMTYAVRRLGYRPVAPRECLAYTDTMDSWKALARQRIRWQRGMLDALRLYGLNRQTLPYAGRLAGLYLGSLVVPLYVAMLGITFVWAHHVGYQPLWLCALPFFAFERWWTVRRLGWREALMAVLLIPEWLYDNYRAVVYWTALVRWLRRTERVWVPT